MENPLTQSGLRHNRRQNKLEKQCNQKNKKSLTKTNEAKQLTET
jgi:hypothetical protein